VQEIYKKLEVDPALGLTSATVKQKNTQHGRNVHSAPPSRWPQRLFWYFFGGFGSILFGGAILVFISWKPLGNPPQLANLVLALALVAVWLAQAMFNMVQELSSSRVMNSITGMLPEDCLVLRAGSKQIVPAAEVVPGDILYFKAGNKMPADVRFIQVTSDTRFDRGILTGESVPVAAVVDSTEENYLETKCIGLQGSYCTSGSGTGVIVVRFSRILLMT
jgi:sodium/potassium-transporting ATPase subunit alpha